MFELYEIWLSMTSQHFSVWFRCRKFIQELLANASEKLWKYMSWKDMTFKPSFYVSASLNSWDPQENDLKVKFWSFSTKKEEYLGFCHKWAPPITLFLIDFLYHTFLWPIGTYRYQILPKTEFPRGLISSLAHSALEPFEDPIETLRTTKDPLYPLLPL